MSTILAIDETSGSQNTAQGGVTANDTGSLTVPDLFEAALTAATTNEPGATREGVALSGFTGSGTGSTVLSFSTTVQDVFFASDSTGAAVNGVDSGLKTLDGSTIFLYTSPLNNNVVLGRAGGSTGDLVFALYLDSVNASGTSVNTTGGGDAGATATKLWLAQYQPIQHIDNPATTTIDEGVIQFLSNKLYVGGNSEVTFDLSNAPSGQNLFLTVGDGSPAAGEAAIVITGLTANDTVNTSQAGSNPIVVGTNNQMIVAGKGLYVSYVTLGGDPDGNGPLLADNQYAVPNLTHTEAVDPNNIRFDTYLPAAGGGFTVVQTQPNNGPVQLLLTAINETDGTEKAGTYFAGLTDGDETSVNITSVSITRNGKTYTASTTGGGVLTLTNDNGTPGDTSDDLTLADSSKVNGKTVTTNVTVDFSGTTALISGLLAGDQVDYLAGSHDRISIVNAAPTGGTAFDVGDFSLRAGSISTQALQDVAFIDSVPTLTFGNLVGTGTDLAQVGVWTGAAGADGLGSSGLDLALTGFSLGGVAQSLTHTTFSEGAFASGAYQFSGSLTGDFDRNAATADTTINFTMSANPTTGRYTLDLSAPVDSVTTTDTANGALGAGGPDAVQTLYIPDQTSHGGKPPPPLQETVVFFSAKIDASASLIASKVIAGQSDPTEAQLEADPQKGTYIDPRAMNVSTSGIGVDNNNLNGSGASGNNAVIDGTDESFVVNPLSLVDRVKVFIDNSVAAYDYAGGERLEYRVIYADGSVSDYQVVTPGMITAGAKPNSPVSFTIDGQGTKIDAVQLTMAYGEIKIPNIQFVTVTEALANNISLDFTATLTDGDGDQATSNFSADLFTNLAANATFDYELLGTIGVAETFDIDLASTRNDYKVTGFDAGTDKLALIGAGSTVGQPVATFDGTNSHVTVLEAPGGQTTNITVMGVDLTQLQTSDYILS